LAFVVGGTSAEFNLKTVKLASTKYLDTLPTSGKLPVPNITAQIGISVGKK
jgi:tartrate dehydratase alpha subunit/fumarate hydratase class I-like protein